MKNLSQFINPANTPQNTGGGTSQTSTVVATAKKGSRPTVNRQSTDSQPKEHRTHTPLCKALKYAAMILLLLTLGVGNVWATTTLFSTNFSTTDGWSNENLTTSSQASTSKTIKGTTVSVKGYKSASAKVSDASTSGGTFTFTSSNLSDCSANSNVSDLNYYIAIPVTGIVAGTVTVTCTTSSNFKFYYTYDDGNSGKVTIARTQAAANNTFTITGLSNTSATIYLGTSGKTMTSLTITTPQLVDLAESAFYQTYASSSKSASELITSASFPSYVSTNISTVSSDKTDASSVSSVSTPHDFTTIEKNSSSYYRLKTANTINITLEALSHVKSIRLYGNGNGSTRTVTVTATKVSGTGTAPTISSMSMANAKAKIAEYTTGDLTALTGYNEDTYYTYTIGFPGAADIWGIYVEYAAPSCSAPAAPTISSAGSKTAFTVGDEIELTATCASGTNASTTYTWYKGATWDAAKVTTPVQAASTSGATFTKTATLDDAATYWCEAANSTCKSHNTTGFAITVAPAAKAYTVTAASNNVLWGTAAAVASSLDASETTSVTATPEEGYKFVSWAVSGTGASLSSTTDNPTTLTMGTANATVTATFRALYTYTMSYAAGSTEGVTGSKDSETKTEDAAFTLPSDAVFELDGYVQTGWATSDGGDKAYDLGGSYTTNSDQAFYPVWTELKTITYHANGGSGSMSDTKGYGSTALRANTFTKDGYVFAGWATSQSNANSGTIAYSDGANVTLSSEDVDLYAVWYTPIYTFTPASSGEAPAINGTISSSTGGTMTYTPTDGSTTGNITYTANGLSFGSGSKCATTIALTDNSLAEGSIIVAKIYNNTKNSRGLKLCTTESTTDLTSGAWTWTLSDNDTPTPETKNCYYTVGSSSSLKNASSFRLLRNNTVYLQSLIVAKWVAPTTPSFTSPASEPAAAAYYVDETVSALEVTATGEPTPTLQWYKNSSKSTSGASSISGATSASYTPSSASTSDFYYYCVATNVAGSAQSEYFHVTVSSAPTYDVTYSSAKGTAPDADEGVSNVTLPTIDPVTGFIHTAWTADQDVTVNSETVDAGTSIAVGTQVFLTANTTFTAVWSTAYTLTLDPKGGACASYTGWTYDSENDKYTKEVASGTEVALPTFTKTNRTFKTWRNNADADDEYAEDGSVTVSADITLNAIWNATVEQVIYSWEGAESGAIEFGGTAVGSEAGLVNTLSEGYYCLRMNGNTDYDKYVEITLSGDEKIKTGDKITYLGFYSNASDKNASPKMRDSNGSKAEIFADPNNLPKINGGVGTPAQRTFTVPEGINTNKVQMTRSKTGSSTMMPKIRIYREVTTEEDNIKTVTFNSNGGSDVAAAEVISGKVVAKPANPTKSGYRFKEWQLSGSAYNFSTAVTANITLDADWTQLYAVTYAAGEGSGTMAADEAAEGDKVTLKANGFTPPTGKVFDAWVVTKTASGDAITVTAGKFTMPAEAVTVTATWKATFTVNYYDEDEETSLGSEEVAVGSHPTASGISAEQDYKTLTWLLNSEAVELDEVSAAAGETVELVASYAPAYASSINIEQWVLNNKVANKAGFIAELEGKGYKQVDLNALDSLNDDPSKANRNYAFLGMKVNKATSAISFLLKAGSTVRAKFGNMGNNVNVIIGEAEPVALTSGSYANSSVSSANEYSYTAEADVIVKFQSTDTKTVVFKQIMIDEAIATVKLPAVVTYDANGGTFGKASEKYTGTPLVIDDATPADEDYEFEGWHVGSVEGEKINAAAYEPTANVTLVAKYVAKPSPFSLSALTYKIGTGDATAVGYEEGTYTYDVELPYAPSYETITVAYTLADGTSSEKSGAVLSVTSVPGAATFTIVAANTTEKTYTVNFTKAAKDGLSIIKATVSGGNESAGFDATGLYAGKGYANTASKKLNTNNYVGVQLKAGQSFQAGDKLFVVTTTDADRGYIELYHEAAGTNLVKALGVRDASAGIELPSEAYGLSELYIVRKASEGDQSWNGTVNYVEVKRPMNPVLKSITFDGTKIEVAGTTVEETLPYATDLTAVTAEYYWNGAGTAVVTTNEGAWAWGDNTYVLTDKDGDATTYTITLVCATRSSDKSLSSLTVDGNAVELKEGVYDYIYEYPYGTDPATVPAVAAEANDAHASVGTITQAGSTSGTASFTVTAEDETEQEYTVSFKISRLPGLVIYDGSTMTDIAAKTGSDLTGFSWSMGSNVASEGSNVAGTWQGKNYEHAIKGFKANASASNTVSFTVPSGYLAKIRLVGSTNNEGNERKMFIAEEATNDASKAIGNYVITSSTYEAQGFVTELLMPGTYYLGSTDSYRLFEFSAQLYPIDYSRDVTPKTYGTICLPNGGIMVGATIYEVAHMTYENNQPYKVFFDEVIDGVMEAGMPYIFLPKEDVTSIAVTYTDEANATAGNYHGLYGTMSYMNGSQLYGKYIFYNNSIFMSEYEGNWLNENRAYIVLNEVPDYVTAPAPGRRRVSMGFNGTNTATGLDAITNDQSPITNKVLINGQLFILRGEKLYDATGRLVK